MVTHFVRPETRFLNAAWARYVVICGQQSLQIFCLGILLAVLAHFVLSEVSRALPLQIAVTAAGILVMIAMALLLDWYKRHDRGRPARPKQPVGAAEAAR